MRDCWEALYRSLMRQIDTKTSHIRFIEQRKRHPELESFERPISLIDYLNSKNDEAERKDRIYRVLIEEVQSNADGRELATALLWLGFWPGLRAIYSRWLRRFPDNNALFSEISTQFTTLIHRLDTNRVNRIAATVVRNVERDVRNEKKRSWKRQALNCPLPNDNALIQPYSSGKPWDLSDLGIVAETTEEEQIESLRKRLSEVIGADTELIIGRVIYEQTHRELGERLGMSDTVVRQRVWRALKRIQNEFDNRRQRGPDLTADIRVYTAD